MNDTNEIKKFSIKQFAPIISLVIILLIIPVLLLFDYKTGEICLNQFSPALQIGVGAFFCVIGLFFLTITIKTLNKLKKGIIIPIDADVKYDSKEVKDYIYNFLSIGIVTILIGETIITGSSILLIWCIVSFIICTIYFKLSQKNNTTKEMKHD
jgi:hypothetical protein